MRPATTRQGVANLDGPKNGKRREVTVTAHACDRVLEVLCITCEQQYIGGGDGCRCVFRCRICQRPM